MSAAALIELSDVGKVYPGGHKALQDINLRVRSGEFVTLLGPSGCGKSTLLRLAAALSLPSSGRIRTPATFHSARRSSPSPEVSCVFQRPTLLPWATAWDNVYLPLRLHGGSRRNARPIVDRALDTVGLDIKVTNPRPRRGR